jgi:DNA topoisomerase II
MVYAKYTKLDHREHVLKRPQMYIGSVQSDSFTAWVYDESDRRMQRREVTYVPGLYKIFDEVLVNAVDHATRLRSMTETPPNLVKNIRITIDRETGYIEVTNDGDGIDVAPHPEHDGVFIPELIFGHLLTSVNYDDEEQKIVGGQNGIGAKACNIFSKHFCIETVDSKAKKLYTQEWHDNMTVADAPKIKACSKRPYTRVQFLPDYERFGCIGISDDMYALMAKRAHDVVAVTDTTVNVFFNGAKLEFKSMERYMDMYVGDKATCPCPRVYEKIEGCAWEVGVAFAAEGSWTDFQHVSFVNGICTLRGGRHVDYIANQIVKKLIEHTSGKRGGAAAAATVKAHHIKDAMFLFLKSTVVNPAFDSQTKETLTTPASKFGCKPEVSAKFIEKLHRTGIVDRALLLSEAMEDKSLKKTDGKKRSVIRNLVKLEDAALAGTSRSSECTLILTEGDSAMTMAMSGIDEVGRDTYGVFPLKGKLLNVKDCTTKKIADNEEISNIKKILGLESSKAYTDVKDLRYGRIMALTDQDTDGSHIKGLLFNLFQSLWPTLFRMDGFMTSMHTPIVKAKHKGGECVSFYTLTDYENWRGDRPSAGWTVKYFKGLGTSTAEEAREYFRSLKMVTYAYDEQTDRSMDLAFSKRMADDRKRWLATYDRQSIVDPSSKRVKFEDFVDKELIHFSTYDVKRSIPSLVDGLKISQRKILYGVFKKKWSGECRVAQLSAYVSENSAYHHGEESLNNAIVGLAQDFVGSNNVNILAPNGQFGSRIRGGKDAASPRYIYTEMAPLTRKIFNKLDDEVLVYLDDDGYPVEPEHFVPVVPMVLINGANGIGTGFSTSVPCHDPKAVIACMRAILAGETALPRVTPWYRGFRGTIVESEDGKWHSHGVISREGATKVLVSELPIGVWTEDFKEVLENAVDTKDYLKGYESRYNDVKAEFILEFASAKHLDAAIAPLEHPQNQAHPTRLHQDLKLVSSKGLSVTNMYMFDAAGIIKKFANVEDICREFADVRISFYEKRKAKRLQALGNDLDVLNARVSFIDDIVEGALAVMAVTKKDLEAQLAAKGYPLHHVHGDYEYLVGMPISSFTVERKLRLQEEAHTVAKEIDSLAALTATDMWTHDLDELEAAYDAERERYDAGMESKRRRGGGSTVAGPGRKRKAT